MENQKVEKSEMTVKKVTVKKVVNDARVLTPALRKKYHISIRKNELFFTGAFMAVISNVKTIENREINVEIICENFSITLFKETHIILMHQFK